MVKRMLGIAVAAALAAAPAALAVHPEDDPDGCRGTIGGSWVRHNSEPRVQVPVVAAGVIISLTDANRGPFYLDIRDIASAYFDFSIWLYQETNGVQRLQRGGRSVVPDTPGTSGEETCKESTLPDQAIF